MTTDVNGRRVSLPETETVFRDCGSPGDRLLELPIGEIVLAVGADALVGRDMKDDGLMAIICGMRYACGGYAGFGCRQR